MTDRHSSRIRVRPLPVKIAQRFCLVNHRRLPHVVGGMWAIAAMIGDCDGMAGVAIVGHPQARMADDGVSLEVLRVAVKDGVPNGCSALYGACARAARDMGALDLFTYLHNDESGHSLRASGWVNLGTAGGGQWSRNERQRDLAIDAAKKVKWATRWSRLSQTAKAAQPLAERAAVGGNDGNEKQSG